MILNQFFDKINILYYIIVKKITGRLIHPQLSLSLYSSSLPNRLDSLTLLDGLQVVCI